MGGRVDLICSRRAQFPALLRYRMVRTPRQGSLYPALVVQCWISVGKLQSRYLFDLLGMGGVLVYIPFPPRRIREPSSALMELRLR